MPACMAHYQFGQEVLCRLDEKTRAAALAFKREFDAGLQGPDIFFFYRPYRRTKIREYGAARHNEPAVRMFAPILERVREKAALSYLMGLVCHYALDKLCHSYIIEHSKVRYDHQRMESAFDKHIMLTHGLSKGRFLHLPAGGLDFEAMASLWPGINAKTLRICVKAERRAIRLLDRRKFLELFEKVPGLRGALTPMTLPEEVPAVMAAHVRQLDALYEAALDESPALIRAALEANGNLLQDGAGFDLNHKGEAEV